jgi:hypothetical protein
VQAAVLCTNVLRLSLGRTRPSPGAKKEKCRQEKQGKILLHDARANVVRRMQPPATQPEIRQRDVRTFRFGEGFGEGSITV